MFPLSAKNARIVIAAILTLAIALRVVAAMVLPDQNQLLIDVAEFRDTAPGLLTHWQMADLHQMPAYPLSIAVGDVPASVEIVKQALLALSF